MNLTKDRRISWERGSSYTSNPDEEVEKWQNRLHEVTTLNCNMMVRSLHCMTTKARELLIIWGTKGDIQGINVIMGWAIVMNKLVNLYHVRDHK